MENILEIFLFGSLFVISYLIISRLNTDKAEEKLEKLLGRISNKNKYEKNKYEYLKKEKETIRDKMSNLIDGSDIKKIVPFFIPEILVLFSISSAILGFYICRNIFQNNISLQIEGAVLGFILPFLYLQNKSICIENDLSKETIRFINKGIGLCKNTNSLMKILRDSFKYSHGKMKEILDSIVSALDSGIDKETVFNNEINKIKNRRLIELLTGLKVAAIEDSSYKEVFLKSKSTNEKYFSIRGDSEIEVKNTKGNLFIGLLFAGIVFIMMFTTIKESSGILFNTVQGQLSIAILGILIIYVIHFFVKMKKFNY